MSNFSGSPSITVPLTKVNGMPFGVTISSKIYTDMKLLNAAYTVEDIIARKEANHE